MRGLCVSGPGAKDDKDTSGAAAVACGRVMAAGGRRQVVVVVVVDLVAGLSFAGQSKGKGQWTKEKDGARMVGSSDEERGGRWGEGKRP